jgi:uncharacterized protein
VAIAIKKEQSFMVPREIVLRALLDPNILKFCIPKCREVRRVTPNQFRVSADIGVLKLTYKFDGVINLIPKPGDEGYDVDASVSYGRTQLGKVTGDVVVEGSADASKLTGQVMIEPMRKFGPVVSKLIQPLANTLVGSFFNRFEIAIAEMDLKD